MADRTPREKLDSLIRAHENDLLLDVNLEQIFCKLVTEAKDHELEELVKDLPATQRDLFVSLLASFLKDVEKGDYRITWLSLEDPRTNEQKAADEDRIQRYLKDRGPRLLELMTADDDSTS